MDTKEIRKLSKQEMQKRIVFLQKELFDNKIKLDLSKIKDTSIIKKIKKEIARIKTILKEKETSKE
jgi:large subunit ribosomal protein L29